MNEKRKYPRFKCDIKTSFDYFVGNPQKIDVTKDKPQKGTGHILDISMGGVFIVTDIKVPVGSFGVSVCRLSSAIVAEGLSGVAVDFSSRVLVAVAANAMAI